MKRRNFFKNLSRIKALFRSRGQVALLWTLLIPILFLFLGLGLDLGWYYLNVSRLQNAADSAAVAGAQKILENKDETVSFCDYKSAALVSKYPVDYPYIVPPINKKLASGDRTEEVINDSHEEALNYAWKNLSSPKDSWESQGTGNYIIQDGWSPKENSAVTMNSSMYQYEDNVYFVVKLQEDIQHFLLPGWFDNMSAPVTAVAMLSKEVLLTDENGHLVADANANNNDERIDEPPPEIVPVPSDAYSSTSGGSSNSGEHKTPPPEENSSNSALNNLVEKIFGENTTTTIASNSTNQDNSDKNTIPPPENYNPTSSGNSTISDISKNDPNNPNNPSGSNTQKPPPENTTKPEPSNNSTVAGISTNNPDNPSSSSESDTQQPPPPPNDSAATPTKPGNSAVGGVTTTTTETRTPNGTNSSGGSNVQPSAPPSSGDTQVAISPTNPNGSKVLPPSQNINSVTPVKTDSGNSSTDSPQTPPPTPNAVTPILPQSGTTTTTPATAINPYPSVIPPVPTPPAVNTVTPYIPIEITTPTTPVTPTPIPSDITETPTPPATKPDPIPTPEKPDEKLLLIFDTNVSQFGGKDRQYMKKISPLKTLLKNHQQVIISASKTPSFGDKTFYGWNTEPDGSGTFIYDGKKLLPAEVASLFGTKKSITLYAQWNEPRNNKTLWEQMQYLIAKNVYVDYWYAAKAKYGGIRPYQNSFIYLAKYNVDDKIAYYAESIDLNGVGKWEETKNLAEATHYYIDFCQSTNDYLQVNKLAKSELNNGLSNVKGGHNYGNLRRAHSLFNINIAYDVRDGYYDDPLYCRIEAEPYVSEPTPIRQIIINVNVDNTADNKRPLFFFYDGPDARKNKSDDGSGQPILQPEKAQPVILNLNANFKGVLFMPNIPVVINGNGYEFEGFIIAKEFRYLSTTDGVQVEYSTKGKKEASANDPTSRIRVDPSTGDVCTELATGNNADELFTYNASDTDKFNLSPNSKFRKFTAAKKINYMYVFYDYSDSPTIDPTPFYDREGNLIPLFEFNEEGKEVRIENWEDVKLYDENGNRIPNTISGNENKGSVRFDRYGNPAPVYDAAGHPIYFCDDYGHLGLDYDIFTFDKTHKAHEFLLTDTEILNVSNTEEWT